MKITGINAELVLNHYPIGSDVGSAEFEESIETLDYSGFTDDTKNYEPGLAEGKVSFTGFVNDADHSLFHQLKGSRQSNVKSAWLMKNEKYRPCLYSNDSVLSKFTFNRADDGSYKVQSELMYSGHYIFLQNMSDGVETLAATNGTTVFDTGSTAEKNYKDIHILNLADKTLNLNIFKSSGVSGGQSLQTMTISARTTGTLQIRAANKFTERYIIIANSDATASPILALYGDVFE